MELKKITVGREELKVEPGEVLALLGQDPSPPDSHTRGLVDLYLDRCRELSDPRGGIAWFGSGTFPSSAHLMLGTTRFHVGKTIAGRLKRSREFVLFAVTLGPGPESLARELIREGNFLEGYLVDLIGSGLVESLVERVHQQIRELAASRGMKVTAHFSPGYCSWEVAEQHLLFGLLPPDWCGITLSDSGLMSPIKSVSGITGIGPGVSTDSGGCSLCPMKNCAFRKQPFQTE